MVFVTEAGAAAGACPTAGAHLPAPWQSRGYLLGAMTHLNQGPHRPPHIERAWRSHGHHQAALLGMQDWFHMEMDLLIPEKDGKGEDSSILYITDK